MSKKGMLFVTLLAANARDRVISAVSSRYTVKQREWSVERPNESLLVLEIASEVSSSDLSVSFEGLFDLIRDTGVLYHSIALAGNNGGTWWRGSNIDYSQVVEPPPKEEVEGDEELKAPPGRYSLITQDD